MSNIPEEISLILYIFLSVFFSVVLGFVCIFCYEKNKNKNKIFYNKQEKKPILIQYEIKV